MKKSLLFMSLMILCTLLMAACGGKKAQGESVNADSDSIAERQQYCFECQFIKAENEEYDSIVVKGYKDGKVAFECRHQLIDYVSAENAAGMPWINDTVDINFDGIPDLEVYLGCYTRGQVAELYAGYVWTPQQKFEEVEEWKDLFNPEIHPEDKTVTANYRSDANDTSGLTAINLNLSRPVKEHSLVTILWEMKRSLSSISWSSSMKTGAKKNWMTMTR